MVRLTHSGNQEVKWLKRAAMGVSLLAVAAAAVDAATYDSDSWIADYERLKGDMAQGYANLDWLAERRPIDLVALDRDTRRRLERAHSRILAILALKDFVGAFGDPHLKLDYGTAPEAKRHDARSSSPLDQPAARDPAVNDCASAGYSNDDHYFKLPFAKLDGSRAIASSWFPAAIVRDVGIIRIAAFGEDRYPAACERAFKPGMTARELKLATRAKLQEELIATIGRLKAAGARHMLVDVTGNGGGTDWVGEATALFTDRRMTRSEPRLVGPSCDRRSVWTGKKPPCAVFPPDTGAKALIKGTGLWTGSVTVLGDGGSGSATEDFIAWLIDNDVGLYAGERSAGAGCGYVDGGNPTYFRVAPLVVRMPNCARFRKDGTNEVEGIEPAIKIPLSQMKRAEKKVALAKLIERVRAG